MWFILVWAVLWLHQLMTSKGCNNQKYQLYQAHKIISTHIPFVTRSSENISSLTHFSPIFHFYVPRKHKSKSFLPFLGSLEMEHWLKWLRKMWIQFFASLENASKVIMEVSMSSSWLFWGIVNMSGKYGLPFYVAFVLTHFSPMISFYIPWKRQKTWFSDIFRRYRNRTLD